MPEYLITFPLYTGMCRFKSMSLNLTLNVICNLTVAINLKSSVFELTMAHRNNNAKAVVTQGFRQSGTKLELNTNMGEQRHGVTYTRYTVDMTGHRHGGANTEADPAIPVRHALSQQLAARSVADRVIVAERCEMPCSPHLS